MQKSACFVINNIMVENFLHAYGLDIKLNDGNDIKLFILVKLWPFGVQMIVEDIYSISHATCLPILTLYLLCHVKCNVK